MKFIKYSLFFIVSIAVVNISLIQVEAIEITSDGNKEEIQNNKVVENTVSEEYIKEKPQTNPEVEDESSNEKDGLELEQGIEEPLLEDEIIIEQESNARESKINEPTLSQGLETEKQKAANNINNVESTPLIQTASTTPFKYGDTREGISEFKKDLVILGFADWDNPSDYFGAETLQTVKKLQEYYGLSVTGVMDQTSLDKVSEELSNLRLGSYNVQVQEFKDDLVYLTYADWDSPSQYFGPETVDVVKEFQRSYGLIVNGIADSVTRSKVEELMTQPLESGLTRKDVLVFKEKLISLGFANWSNPSAWFGPDTKATVEKFQKNYGLSVTGVMDEASLVKLEEELNSPQLGSYSSQVQQFKEDLVFLTFADWNGPSPYFGSETVEAVKEFQKAYGLFANGIADSVTRNKVEELMTQPLESGLTRKDVLVFKEKLVSLGFANWSNPSAWFGPDTKATVEKFQKNYGLSITGVMDEASLVKLDEELNSPQLGSYSSQVQQFKEDLVFLTFADWDGPSPYFGSETVKAVKKFQKAYGLFANGIADSVTISKVEELMTMPLESGLTRKDVLVFKEKLVSLGFANWSNPSAWFGPDTKKTVEKFQNYYNLSVTGVMDQSSLEKLEEVYSSPKLGSYSSEVQQIKEDLVSLGFANWDSPSQYFGADTDKVVREFQSFYQLIPNGVIDELTLKKIQGAFSDILKSGDYNNKVSEMKQKLVELKFADWDSPSQWYGPETVSTVEAFQKYYNLPITGEMNAGALAQLDKVIMSPLQTGNSSRRIQEIKKDLVRLGFVDWKNPGTDFGPKTKEAVVRFQEYYGLKSHGIIDHVTISKIQEILSSPIQYGKTNSQVLEMKFDLIRLNFANWTNPSSWFGPDTELVVKSFQRYFGLVENGIVDSVTLEAIEDALKSSQTVYNITLLEALQMQMNVSGTPPQSDKYRNDPAFVSANYISISTGGAISENSVRLRTSTDLGTNSNVAYTVNKGAVVSILDRNVKGDSYAGSTNWYKIKYNGKELYVHSSLVNISSKIGTTTAAVNIRAGKGTTFHIYTKVPKGTTFTIIKEGEGWHQINLGNWRNAISEDVLYYLDPSNFINDEKQKFQFLDLSRSSGVSVSTLNNYLKGKGKLEGQGQAFIDAGLSNGVNDLYLVSHALLETGNGTSELAQGVMYKGVKVYNMFGIGAYDGCAIQCGAEKAYNEGWTSPYKAIVGGARFIGSDYIKAGQNTLYKMRWNPAGMEKYGYATHQYATDIGWASKQINSLYNLYNEVGSFTLLLDYPVYKGY